MTAIYSRRYCLEFSCRLYRKNFLTAVLSRLYGALPVLCGSNAIYFTLCFIYREPCMDDVKSVAINVLSNFIHMGLVWLFCWGLAKYKANQLNNAATAPTPPPVQRSQPTNAPSAKPVELGMWGYTALTYFFTVFLIYFAVSIAPILKASFSKQPVLLSDASYIGHLLPAIPLSGGYFQWVFVLITLLLFIPCMAISSLVKQAIIGLIPSVSANARVKFGIHYFTVAVLCAPIAATSIVLFFAKTYKDAFTYVGLVVFLIVAMATNQKK